MSKCIGKGMRDSLVRVYEINMDQQIAQINAGKKDIE